jgi:hypothetical protein
VSRYNDEVILADLVGPVEVADMLGVKVNTIAQWRKRFADFPAPLIELSGTYIWNRHQITEWAVAHGRYRHDGQVRAPIPPTRQLTDSTGQHDDSFMSGARRLPKRHTSFSA